MGSTPILCVWHNILIDTMLSFWRKRKRTHKRGHSYEWGFRLNLKCLYQVLQCANSDWRRIKDFPAGEPIPKAMGHRPIIWRNFPENCMKMQKMGSKSKICVCRFTSEKDVTWMCSMCNGIFPSIVRLTFLHWHMHSQDLQSWLCSDHFPRDAVPTHLSTSFVRCSPLV